MDLNHVVISIYQNTFIQMKAMQSLLKRKLGAAGYNVHAGLSGTTNNVFMTEFDSFFWFKFFMLDGHPYFLAFGISSYIYELMSVLSLFE